MWCIGSRQTRSLRESTCAGDVQCGEQRVGGADCCLLPAAYSYSTLHKLLAEPYIQRWVAYAQKIPARTRAEARAHLRNAK